MTSSSPCSRRTATGSSAPAADRISDRAAIGGEVISSVSSSITGTPVTESTGDGARLLEAAIAGYLASRTDTPAILKQAIGNDPDHLMARCMMGYLTRLAGDRRNARRSQALHDELGVRVESGAGTPWERAHVTALGLWLEDDLHALMDHFERLLEAWPNDVLTLRLLHHLYFYDGDIPAMRDSVARQLPGYAGHRFEGYVKGMLAFALEEAGDYQAAERLGREAMDADPQDIWAGHAVAHVMEMQGRTDEGIRWIDGLQGEWDAANNFRFHLIWHQALYYLAEDRADRVLALYDRHLAPAVEDDFYLDLCNAASLLLRLEAAGVDVGARWAALTPIAAAHAEDTELVFASLHYLMPLLRTGHPAAATVLAGMDGWAKRDTTQGRVVREVARHVCAFLVAALAGDRAAAPARFEDFRSSLHRIGGSRAQRQLFGLLLNAAPETRH